jgi:hypothetical protein
MTITLGIHTITLRQPPSMMIRRDVALAVQKNPIRGLCAALGVCWGGKPLKARFAYDALGYGGDVFDELMSLGIPEADIYAAAGKALELLNDTPTEPNVARAEGFTEPQKGP